MKIIDLLNKIANGEIPKKIRFKGREWDYDEEFNNGLYTDGMGTFSIYGNELLEEVEILEKENKIPEKLNIEDDGNTITLFGEKENEWTILDNVDVIICNKINSIIDYLKSKGE